MNRVSFKLAPASPASVAAPPSAPRIIAVTSGKGGVGKTHIVANLGLALARQGLKTLLIDADLGLANLDLLLGLSPRYTINDMLALRRTLDQVLVEGPEGLKVLPASSGIPELAELDDHQRLFLLDELDHYQEALDVVLIDTGAGISRNVMFFNLAAWERIVVANNQPTSLTDAYALIKVMATRYGQRSFKLLVNDVPSAREASAVYLTLLQVAERFLGSDLSLEYLGFIPHDGAFNRAALKQQPVLTAFPRSQASQAFAEIARTLWEARPPGRMEGNLKFFWRRLLQQKAKGDQEVGG
jgi:flagellar biosynthesis protein FlhG